MSGFWERRKAAVAAEEQAEAQAHEAALAEAEERALEEKTDEELLAEHGLRDPDEIESAEEVQAFLKTALPQRLKTRALRKLWRLNPVLANLDGLVDYGEDFTDKAMVIENMQTVYQVGKGMFDKAVEAARAEEEKLARAAEALEQEVPDHVRDAEGESPDDTAPATEPEPLPEPPVMAFDDAQPDATHDTDEMRPAPVRRMRFRFDNATQQG